MSENTNLMRLRKEKGYTQVEIAQKIGVDIKTYRNWEKGKTSPKYIELVYKLCELLGCEIDFIFDKIPFKNKELSNLGQLTGLNEKAIDNLCHLGKNEINFINALLSDYIMLYNISMRFNNCIQNETEKWTWQNIIKTMKNHPSSEDAEVSLSIAERDLKQHRFDLTDAILTFENEYAKKLFNKLDFRTTNEKANDAGV